MRTFAIFAPLIVLVVLASIGLSALTGAAVPLFFTPLALICIPSVLWGCDEL